jgi:hypothetical protein
MITFYVNVYRLILIFDKNPVSRLIISSPFIGSCMLLAISCFIMYYMRFLKNGSSKPVERVNRPGLK